jgi:hypothetical protein
MTAPSEDILVASQGGTRPPCKGSTALPDRLAIRIVKSWFDPSHRIRRADEGQFHRSKSDIHRLANSD